MGAGASKPLESQNQQKPAPSSSAPVSASDGASCPVDHTAREAWLAQAAAAKASGDKNENERDKGSPGSAPSTTKKRELSRDREVSTIPRAVVSSEAVSSPEPSPYASCPVSHGAPSYHDAASQQQQQQQQQPPSNDEAETGYDTKSGRWVYPSERQFFDALVRKNTPNSTTSPSDLATSVASIIPIHNAVNERVWSQVVAWERSAPLSDPGSAKCGGPKLFAFRGLGADSRHLSPRARFNSLLGYQRPFDRHDWTVERCGGERIEYVIDFYQGRSPSSTASSAGKDTGLLTAAGPGKLSFYLDVRPKLNSWEGCRMRFMKYFGL